MGDVFLSGERDIGREYRVCVYIYIIYIISYILKNCDSTLEQSIAAADTNIPQAVLRGQEDATAHSSRASPQLPFRFRWLYDIKEAEGKKR